MVRYISECSSVASYAVKEAAFFAYKLLDTKIDTVAKAVFIGTYSSGLYYFLAQASTSLLARSILVGYGFASLYLFLRTLAVVMSSAETNERN